MWIAVRFQRQAVGRTTQSGNRAGKVPDDCLGPGSNYKSKSVMKDPAKAKAAGLVMPDKAFCAKCHRKGVDDPFMEEAHAHDE